MITVDVWHCVAVALLLLMLAVPVARAEWRHNRVTRQQTRQWELLAHRAAELGQQTVELDAREHLIRKREQALGERFTATERRTAGRRT